MIQFFDHVERLLVRDYAFVGLFHFECRDSVDVRPGALLEAMWERQLVEQVSVDGNVSKVVLGAR